MSSTSSQASTIVSATIDEPPKCWKRMNSGDLSINASTEGIIRSYINNKSLYARICEEDRAEIERVEKIKIDRIKTDARARNKFGQYLSCVLLEHFFGRPVFMKDNGDVIMPFKTRDGSIDKGVGIMLRINSVSSPFSFCIGVSIFKYNSVLGRDWVFHDHEIGYDDMRRVDTFEQLKNEIERLNCIFDRR